MAVMALGGWRGEELAGTRLDIAGRVEGVELFSCRGLDDG